MSDQPNAPPPPKKWLPAGKGYLPANEIVGQLGPSQRQQRQRLVEQQARMLAEPKPQELASAALHHAVRVTAQ